MQVTDTIADLLTRIRNAQAARHDTVEVPASNMKKAICQILVDEGYVKNFTVTDDGKQGIINITLKYGAGRTPRYQGPQESVKARPAHLFQRAGAAESDEGPRNRRGFHFKGDHDGPGSQESKRRRRSAGVHLVKEGCDNMSRIGRKPINIPAGVDVKSTAAS